MLRALEKGVSVFGFEVEFKQRRSEPEGSSEFFCQVGTLRVWQSLYCNLRDSDLLP